MVSSSLGMKVHLVLASPIKLAVAFLPPETNYFGEREPFHADVGEALPHLVQTPLPDYGIDPFHLWFLPGPAPLSWAMI